MIICLMAEAQKIEVNKYRIDRTDKGFVINGTVTATDLNPPGQVVESDILSVVACIKQNSSSQYPKLPESRYIVYPPGSVTAYTPGSGAGGTMTKEEYEGIGIAKINVAGLPLRTIPVWSSYGGIRDWMNKAPSTVMMGFEGIVPLEYEGKEVKIVATLEHVWGGPYANWPAYSYAHAIVYEDILKDVAGTTSREKRQLTLDDIIYKYKVFGNNPRKWPDGNEDDKALVGPAPCGALNNIFDSVLRDMVYKRYNCIAMQYKTLVLLNELKNSGELENFDYMPVTGISLPYPEHNAVVIWPKGGDWKKDGIILDPHGWQKPYWYSVKDGVFEWHFDRQFFDVYPNFEQYPSEKSPKYTLENFSKNPEKIDRWGNGEQAMTPWDEPPTERKFVPVTKGWDTHIAVYCPVEVLVVDSQGHQFGRTERGDAVSEFQPNASYHWQDEKGERQFYLMLPEGSYEIKLRGIRAGPFHLLTYTKETGMLDYGENPIDAGDELTLVVSLSQNPRLILNDGREAQPKAIPLPNLSSSRIGEDEPVLSSEIEDARVYEYPYLNWDDANWGGWESLALKSNVNGLPNTRGRIFLRFDAEAIPYNRETDRVLLRLTHLPTEQDANVTANLYRVLEPWNEGNGTYHPGQQEPDARGAVSWNNQPTFDANRSWASQELYPSSSSYNVSWDITDLVDGWISGEFANYGLILAGDGEGTASYSHIFASTESSDQLLRPAIVVIGPSADRSGEEIPDETEETEPKFLHPAAVNLKDARVYQYAYLNWNNANWGGWDYLALKSKVNGISDTNGRIYIWFDPALLGNISQDQDVYLQLVHWPTEQEGNMTANIFPVTEPWQEGNGTYHPGQNEPDAAGTISWSTQPAWEGETIWASQDLYPSPEPYNVSWNITGLARAWISGQLPNYGLVIVGSDEGAASYSHVFGSSNNPDPAMRPRILIGKAPRSSGTEGQEGKGGKKGLSTGSAILRDWDTTGDKFSFDNGTCSGGGYSDGQADLFIASRENDPIIHVFESPGIIDLGEVGLDGLRDAPESGYKENEPPIVGHTYVTKSRGKFGAIRLTDIKLPPEVPEAEYSFDWIYQPDGSRYLNSSQVISSDQSQNHLFLEVWTDENGTVLSGTPVLMMIDFPTYSLRDSVLTPTLPFGIGAEARAVIGIGRSLSGDLGGGASSSLYPINQLPYDADGVKITEIKGDVAIFDYQGKQITLGPGEKWQDSVEESRTVAGTEYKVEITTLIKNHGRVELQGGDEPAMKM